MDGTFKDKLMSALHSAVGNFNQGGDPNAAVVKAASDFNFNVDQTARLIETFNTARTIYHYKSAADRTQTFDLADASLIIPEMFKAPVEKAASFDPGDYSEYDKPEFNFQDNMVLKAGGVHDDIKEAASPVFLDTDLDTLGARANKIMHVQRDLAKTARDEARICASKSAQILSKLAADLGLGYFENCASKFGRLFGGYANNVNYSPVMDKFAEFVPKQYQVKFAEDVLIDDSDLVAATDALKEAKSYMEAEAEFLGYASVLEKEANDFEVEFMGMLVTQLPENDVKVASVLDMLNPVLVNAAAPPKGPGQGGDKPEKKEPLFQFGPLNKEPKPGILRESVGGGITEGAKKTIADQVGTGLEKIIFGPSVRENKDLSERLKNTHRQIMLEDLMTNDPVLSDAEPQNVANAYSAILSMAPDLASNKEVVRAILRQSVHAVAISPYEAEQWTNLEKNIRNITGKADTKGVPIKDYTNQYQSTQQSGR